jgi:nitrogen regulatory protein P-II 1
VQLITVVTRPGTFETIKEALALFGVRGMTVTEVNQVSRRVRPVQVYRGVKFTSDMAPGLRIDLVVPNDEVPDVVHVINKILSTSDPDDAILWHSPVEILARVRTGEYGLDAL